MFTATSLTWLAVGVMITALTFVLDGGFKRSSPAAFVVTAIVVALFGWIVAFITMASFSPWLLGTWAMAFFLAYLSSIVRGLLSSGSSVGSGFTYGALTLFFAVFAIGASAPIFHAERYGKLLVPEIKERDVAAPLVDQTQARIVTDPLAIKRAAEILASSKEEGLGSRVEMGEPWGNEIEGTMYWAIPLEHSSVFKYFSNGTTPGYIAVSQTNEMNTKFVQDMPMRIGVNAWFDDNVYRHLYNRGFKSYIMGTAILSIDPKWTPYWLVPLSLPQIGFGGEMPVKWSLVNAVTGDVQTFDDPSKVPEWVDRLYHQDMVSERFNDWGCWSRGFVACMISGNDTIKSTPGINVTLSADQKIIYYSGTQFEKNKAEGATSGFYTFNARTGHTTFFRRAGITEEAAKQVMKGAFADFDGYEPADLVPLTLNGEHPVFFSVIVDGAGSRKAFAIVSMNNRNVIGKGNSVQAALTDFNRSMQRSNRDATFEPGKAEGAVSFEGKVITLTSVVSGDRTSFYLTLDSLPGKIIEVSEEKIGEIVVTKVGDAVRVTTDNADPAVIFSTAFDNLGFTPIEGGIQPVVDARNAEEKAEREKQAMLIRIESVIAPVKEKIAEMSPEEIEAFRAYIWSDKVIPTMLEDQSDEQKAKRKLIDTLRKGGLGLEAE